MCFSARRRARSSAVAPVRRAAFIAKTLASQRTSVTCRQARGGGGGGEGEGGGEEG